MFIKYGVGVLIIDDDKVLLGHRVNNAKDTGGIYEPDTWTLPGGKQEYDETIFECAIRETKEETNLDLEQKDLEIINTCDDYQPGKHFKTIHVLAKNYSGNLKVMEKDKIDKWKWYSFEDLPEKINSPSQKEIDGYLKIKRK